MGQDNANHAGSDPERLRSSASDVCLINTVQDRFSLRFQDIVDQDSGAVFATELLAKPVGPNAVRPYGHFFQTLHSEDSLSLLAWQVSVAQRLYDQRGIRIVLNVANGLLFSDVTAQALERILGGVSVPLMLDISAGYALPHRSTFNALAARLRERDCLIALDDFGRGGNGLGVLCDYDFDFIRLDPSLTLGVVGNIRKPTFLRSLRQMLTSLGFAVIVEGVETELAREAFVSAGFRYLQGFLLHRPEAVSR